MSVFNFERATKRFHNYFEKEIRKLFLFYILILALGFVFDLFFHYKDYSSSFLFIDILAIFTFLIFLILAFKKKISIQFAHILVSYFLIFFLNFLYYYQIKKNEFNPYIIFQDMLAIPFILISIGLIVSKKSMIIWGVVTSILYTYIIYYSKNDDLIHSVPIIFEIIILSSIALAFFINAIEKSLEEREKTEIEIREQQKYLINNNEEKDKLFSVIANDLRLPINTVKEMIDLVISSPFSILEKEEILKSTSITLEKSVMLLNDLLNFSESKLEPVKFNPQNLNLFFLVKDTIDLLHVIISEKKIKIYNRVPQRIFTYSDKILLYSILRNILANSIKMAKSENKIIIDADFSDNNVLTKIVCNGVKLENEKLRDIFSSSSKTIVPEEDKDGKKEKIFGLNMTKDFVEKNGGKIWVEVDKEKTIFYFTLPLGSA